MDMPWWLALQLVVLGGAVLFGLAMALHALIGRDFWPFTTKGPFQSHEEAEWKHEAYLEHEKTRPYPGS